MINWLNKKIKIIAIIFTLILMFILVFSNNKTIIKATEDKSVDIVACNLSFQDSVKIMYAVDSTNISDKENIKVLIFESSNEKYIKGEEDYYLSFLRYETINEKEYAIFLNPYVAAKQMADDFYAVPYYNDSGKAVYGDVVKYSVLRYAYNLNKKEDANIKLKNLVNKMLEYGALAQEYFEYNLDRLATDEYFVINLVNEKFNDGTNYCLAKSGDKLTITSSNPNFKCWTNNGNYLSINKSYKFTVNNNMTITSIESYIPSHGLSYSKEYNTEEKYYYYSIDGIGSCTDDLIVIPDTYDDKPVEVIGDFAFINNENITTIVLGENIKKINDKAFKSCRQLKNVEFNDELTYIGSQAFCSCDYLENITLPDSLEKIDENAFESCNALSYIFMGNKVKSIGDDAFYHCNELFKVFYNGTSSNFNNIIIGENNITFTDRVCFYSDTLPEEGLYWHYVDGDPMLWGITIENELVFDWDEFHSTYGIKSVNDCTSSFIALPIILNDNIVTRIHENAFLGDKNLESLFVPLNIGFIGDNAFEGCDNLNTIYYEGNSEDFDNYILSISSKGNDNFKNATVYFYSNEEPVEAGNYWHLVNGEIVKWN